MTLHMINLNINEHKESCLSFGKKEGMCSAVGPSACYRGRCYPLLMRGTNGNGKSSKVKSSASLLDI